MHLHSEIISLDLYFPNLFQPILIYWFSSSDAGASKHAYNPWCFFIGSIHRWASWVVGWECADENVSILDVLMVS